MAEYFVATTGNDTFGDGSINNPFRTIQRGEASAIAGDFVTIRGGTYRENISITKSGSVGNPITFRAYQNEVVVVSGTQIITGTWQNHSGLIEKIQLNNTYDLGLGINQLFVNGEMVGEARWPALPSNVKPWRTERKYQALSQAGALGSDLGGGLYAATYQNAGLTAFANLVGAKMIAAQGLEWKLNPGTVTAHSGDTITYSYPYTGGSADIPRGNNPFHLWGLLDFLTVAGQWFFDRSTYILYYWPKGTPISASTIEMKRSTQALLTIASNRSYITFERITFFAGTIQCDGSNIIFDHINSEYGAYFHDIASVSFRAVKITGSSNQILNSSISKSSVDGLEIQGSNHIVRNTIIEDVGFFGGNGIEMRGTTKPHNLTIENNTVRRTGTHGINFSASASHFSYNEVCEWGGMVQDVSGFNTWNSGDGQNTEIHHNLATNPRGVTFDNTYGLEQERNAGHGFRCDSGGALLAGGAAAGCSNYWLHHNIAFAIASWYGKLRFGMSLWGLTGTQANKGNCGIRAWNNCVKNIKLPEGAENYGGMEIVNNLVEEYIDSRALLYTANNLAYELLANFLDPLQGDWRLKPTSAAISAGALYPTGTVVAPNIGATEAGAWFVSGALILTEHLSLLQLRFKKVGTEIVCIVSNIAVHRRLPVTFQITIDGETKSFINIIDFATGFAKGVAVFSAFSGVVEIAGAMGLTNIDYGTIDAATIPDVYDTLYARSLSLTNATSPLTLTSYQATILLDTATLISQGKLNTDGSGLTFWDGNGFLSYWVESGWNTNQTRIWVQSPSRNATVQLVYNSDLGNLSNGKLAFPLFFDNFSDGVFDEEHFNITNPSRTDIQVVESVGCLGLVGTSTEVNFTTATGFSLENAQIPYSPSFGIDSGLEIVSFSPPGSWKASLGATETLMGVRSLTPTDRQIGYFSGGAFYLGDSTMDAIPLLTTPVTQAYLYNSGNGETTLKWFENGNEIASRSGLINPGKGVFDFAPGVANSTFHVCLRYIAVHKMSPDGVLVGGTPGSESTFSPASYPLLDYTGGVPAIAPVSESGGEGSSYQSSSNLIHPSNFYDLWFL